MNEFELISRIKERFSTNTPSCAYPALLGMGDDAAVLAVPEGKHLVVSTDTLVSGVHFFADAAASDIAAKSLSVSLSDLASMGAEPAWFFLAISLPQIDPEWWDEFCEGLLETAMTAKIDLAGGDTTRGPLSVTITAMGLVEQGKALRRGGARPGDLVVVSGQPGLAALALQQIQNGEKTDPEAAMALKRPQPRLTLGQALVGQASACIDISDGLLADLGHILKASCCGAEISLGQLPRLAAMSGLDEAASWKLQLAGGDDYELCFTLPQQQEQALPELQKKSGVALHVLGKIVAGSGLKLHRVDGQEFFLDRSGYEHFSPKS